MESLRITRLVMDVPPSPFVSVMTREIFNMGTIDEGEMEINVHEEFPLRGSSSARSSILKEIKRSFTISDHVVVHMTIIEEETGTNVVEGHTSSLKGSSHSSAFSRESYKISVCGQE